MTGQTLNNIPLNMGIARLSIQNKGGMMRKISAKVHIIVEAHIEADNEKEYQAVLKEFNSISGYTSSIGGYSDWKKTKVVRVDEVMKITNTTKESKTDER